MMPIAAVSPPPPGAFRRAWWGPLGIVVATLVALAVAPFVTSARVRARREVLSEEVDPARVLVNDVETALATQLYTLGELAQRNPAERADAAARYRAAWAVQAAREVVLDSLVQRIGPTATERFVELRTLAAEWHRAAPLPPADTGLVVGLVGARPASAGALALARATMDAADRLERLVQLATAADEGRRTLAAAAAVREALLRGVTHDVKNPLGAALGYAQLLEDGVLGPVSDAPRDVAVWIRHLMQLALGTVTDLLELSRAEAGPLPVTPMAVDLGHVVRDAVADYEASARAAQLRLEVLGSATPPRLTTDPARVRQVLGNLLSNAIKYTPSGGPCTLPSPCGTARRGSPFATPGRGSPPPCATACSTSSSACQEARRSRQGRAWVSPSPDMSRGAWAGI